MNLSEILLFILYLLACGTLLQAQTGFGGKVGAVKIPLRHAFGINAFEWDFENEKETVRANLRPITSARPIN